MAIDITNTVRTGNVIRLGNVHFDNTFGKQVTTENIDFSQYETFRAHLARAHQWVKNGCPDDVSPYVLTPYWDYNCETAKQMFDLAALVNRGVKYLYVLGNLLQNHSNQSIHASHTSFVAFDSSNNYLQPSSYQRDVSEYFRVIRELAVDESAIVANLFDVKITENIYNIQNYVADGYTKGFFSWVAHPERNPEESSGKYGECPNTAITHPVAYWIFEN